LFSALITLEHFEKNVFEVGAEVPVDDWYYRSQRNTTYWPIMSINIAFCFVKRFVLCETDEEYEYPFISRTVIAVTQL
jgi:hypothetical protein